MKKQQKRKWYCLFLCVLFLLSGCAVQSTEPGLENPGVKITFFDVGKGDAILIETQEHTMMIDAGYDDTYKVIRDYLSGQGIQKLDYLVITHFDKDHVGGADRVINSFEVEKVLQPDYQSDAGQYLEYCAVLERKGIQPDLVTGSMQLSLDGAEFYVYPPQEESYKEEDNDFSLVISMAYGEKRFLFAGDSEKVRINELLNQDEFEISHDLLKVPHHGKKEDNSEEFFEAVVPGVAVVTCSDEQPVSNKVYGMLEELGTEIYLTSDGTVTCLCDGETLQMVQD